MLEPARSSGPCISFGSHHRASLGIHADAQEVVGWQLCAEGPTVLQPDGGLVADCVLADSSAESLAPHSCAACTSWLQSRSRASRLSTTRKALSANHRVGQWSKRSNPRCPDQYGFLARCSRHLRSSVLTRELPYEGRGPTQGRREQAWAVLPPRLPTGRRPSRCRDWRCTPDRSTRPHESIGWHHFTNPNCCGMRPVMLRVAAIHSKQSSTLQKLLNRQSGRQAREFWRSLRLRMPWNLQLVQPAIALVWPGAPAMRAQQSASTVVSATGRNEASTSAGASSHPVAVPNLSPYLGAS